MADCIENDSPNELSQENLDKIAGGWYDLPANAPKDCKCPRCGTLCWPRTIGWGQRVGDEGPLKNNRVVGQYECPNCDFTWEISNIIA